MYGGMRIILVYSELCYTMKTKAFYVRKKVLSTDSRNPVHDTGLGKPYGLPTVGTE